MQFISPFFRSRADTCKLERLPIECRKYLHVLWLSINTLCNWFKYRSVIQSEVRPKPSVTRSCIFPALFAVNVYFSLDWFIGLSAFFVIVPFSNLPYKPTDYFCKSTQQSEQFNFVIFRPLSSGPHQTRTTNA